MRKILLMLALVTGVASAHAQSADTTAVNDLTLKADIYPGQEDGDIYHGLSRKLTFDRMIPPYGLEVTYGKTTHIIFPSAVRYVDLGSPNLIAGKADGAENVIRVKATVRNFREETNMSVITESGSFYTFNVKYADEPLLLNIEMKDFIHDGSEVNPPYLQGHPQGQPAPCQAYREQGVRHPVPAARTLYTQRTALFPYPGEEHVERAL